MYYILGHAADEAERAAFENPDEYRPLHNLFAIQCLLLEAGFDPQQEDAEEYVRPLDSVITSGTCVCCLQHMKLSKIMTGVTGCAEMLS